MNKLQIHNLTKLVFVLTVLVWCSSATLAQVAITYPQNSVLSDYKPSSILIYPKYTSNASAPQLGDTQINITNTSQTLDINIHLFAVDGSSCSVADSFISLTRNQTATLLMSDFDPGVTGYLIALATDGGSNKLNWLIGDEYIRETDGRQANIQAIGVAKISDALIPDDGAGSGQLVFDGIQYERLPAAIGLSNFNSQVTDSTQINLLTPTSNLALGTPPPSTRLFTLVYNDVETAFSTSISVSCYSTFLLNSLRITGGLNTQIPAGRTGWIRFNGSGKPIFGYAQNRGPVFNGGHNMHVLQLLATYTITVPIF